MSPSTPDPRPPVGPGAAVPRAPVPPAVARTVEAAQDSGFAFSCRDEVGRLLAVLAASTRGSVAELGTGVGCGTAWLASGLPPSGTLVTVDIDARRSEIAERAVADPRVRFVVGDAADVHEWGPFDLVFVDAPIKRAGVQAVLALDVLRPGSVVVMDDFTPSAHWPPQYEGAVDRLRMDWLEDPRFVCHEVAVAPDHAVLIAVVRSEELAIGSTCT